LEPPDPKNTLAMATSSGSKKVIPILDFLVENIEASIPIRDDQLGEVIGSEETMEASSGAKMWVDKEGGCVRISGEKSCVRAGQKLVHNLLQHHTLRVPISRAEIPKVKGRRVGVVIDRMQLRSGAEVFVDRPLGQVVIRGDDAQIRLAVEMLTELLGRPVTSNQRYTADLGEQFGNEQNRAAVVGVVGMHDETLI